MDDRIRLESGRPKRPGGSNPSRSASRLVFSLDGCIRGEVPERPNGAPC